MRPNIVFICTDQQSLRAMSAAGNPHLRTPQMDSLAACGVRFEKSYCTSPVCGPSRSSLLTGRMPHEVGVNFNNEMTEASSNIGEILRAGGYETAWTGKWHLQEYYLGEKNRNLRGFDFWGFPEAEETHLGTASDEPSVEAAVHFLQREHAKPFFLGVSLINPHDICYEIAAVPEVTPAEAAGLPPLPANFERDPAEPEFITDCHLRAHYGNEVNATRNWTPEQWRYYLHVYYRLTEKADALIGRVLAGLRASGLEENTVIIFTSDHGEGMAAHRWVAKLMPYEETTSVPFIVSWKGVSPAGVVDRTHLVSGVDVLPTVCDYAGIQPPGYIRGRSLRPLIENTKQDDREFLVTELQPDPQRRDRMGRIVRTARYKYVAFSYGKNPEMLFDLESDPGEIRNLASHSDLAEVLRHHRAFLQQWIEQTDDIFTPAWR